MFDVSLIWQLYNCSKLRQGTFVLVNIYWFKANSGNTRTMSEVCSKLKIKKTVNDVVLVSFLLILNKFYIFSIGSIDEFEQLNVEWVRAANSWHPSGISV